MFPLSCESNRRPIPPGTLLLVICCCVLFALQRRPGEGGLIPLDLTHALLHPSVALLGAPLSIVRAFFTHAGIVHLLSNMWFLWIFGGAVEDRAGLRGLVRVYFLCGAASMVVQAAVTPLSSVPIVGASGAIAGLMGYHLVSRPTARILLWVPPVFFPRVPSFLFLGLWLFLQYAGMRGESLDGRHIAWWAHIGGFLFGLLLGLVARRPRSSGGRTQRR